MRIRSNLALATALCMAALGLFACTKPAPPAETTTPEGELGMAPDAGSAPVQLNGAGATFPAPLYSKWFRDYHESHPNVMVDYQSIGSGGGIKNVIDGTVDFGGSDAAMKDDEMAQVTSGVQLLPMTAGGIVLTYNLAGVEDLKLSREAYVGIFLGHVTHWNDPAIVAENPGVELPDEPINVIVRADGSGTTFVFTKHLAEISPEFAESPGCNKLPNWPVGTKSKGNEGISASIKTTPGSIGYVEYGYAANQGLPMVSLENQAGKYVKPSPESSQAALAHIELPENLIGWAPDPEGDDSYPIVTFTWIICYLTYDDQAKLDALKDVLKYCLTDGQQSSDALGYIALPPEVVDQGLAALDNITLKQG